MSLPKWEDCTPDQKLDKLRGDLLNIAKEISQVKLQLRSGANDLGEPVASLDPPKDE